MQLSEIPTGELQKELAKRKSKSNRFEITGEWSGYRSSQRRIVHREYTTDKILADKVRELGSITYTDGTRLDLSVRQMEYRERKQKENRNYDKLIRDCLAEGVSCVSDLARHKKAQEDV